MPVTSKGRSQSPPLATAPNESDRSGALKATTSDCPSAYIALRKRPMSLATNCSRAIPMPSFTLSLRTQHRSGAVALVDP